MQPGINLHPRTVWAASVKDGEYHVTGAQAQSLTAL